jgi:hypothetical protein
MKNQLLIFAFSILSVFIISCSKKDKLEYIDYQQFRACSAPKKHDSTKLTIEIVGTWKWTTRASEMLGATKADKEIFLNLTPAGTFTVTENSVIITEGKWCIGIEDHFSYGLNLDKPSNYLSGIIYLCDNQVLFNDSYRDGSDNIFVRVK